jgi:hypothetical protein
MINKTLSVWALVCAAIIFLSACQDNVSPNLEESLDLFAGLEVITEAQQTNVTINRGTNPTDGYFTIQVDNIDDTPLLAPGVHEAWCLEWNKNLRSNGDVHQDVKWFSTGDNDTWKPLNYLFSIRPELQANDEDLTFREIQAVVWVLAGEMGIAPDFDVLNLPVDRIPSRLRNGGELAIDREKVAAIAKRVMQEAPTATGIAPGTVAQTAEDQQDMYTPLTNEIVEIDAPSSSSGFYASDEADFGPGLTTEGVSGEIVLANDGTGIPTTGCNSLIDFPSGSIALIDRGGCNFDIKVFNAQTAGAVAVIVANNIPEGTFGSGLIRMAPLNSLNITIPSVFITFEDGNTIKSGLPATGTLRLRQ